MLIQAERTGSTQALVPPCVLGLGMLGGDQGVEQRRASKLIHPNTLGAMRRPIGLTEYPTARSTEPHRRML
jgi:hypothetical protein